MVRLVHDDHADRVKRTDRIASHAQRLNHADDEWMFQVALVTLDTPDRRTGTKLTDAFDPLVGQKLFVDDDQRSGFHSARDCEAGCRLAHARVERKDAVAFVLVVGRLLIVSEFSGECHIDRDGFGTRVPCGRSELFLAVKSRNAQMTPRFAKHLERRRAKAECVFDRPDGKFSLEFTVRRRDIAGAS